MEGEIRVLYFEDEFDFADLTRTFLEREKERFAVDIAVDIHEGLDQLEANEYDCIISDYDMPQMNGVEVLGVVREDYPDLPFILFTGKGSEEVASEAISAGVSDYLQKEGGTSQYAILANRVENTVTQYRSAHALERTERRYHRLIEEANDVIVILDANARFEYLTPGAERILGYEPEDLIGEIGFDYVHPDDIEQTMGLFFEMIEQPELKPTTEFRFRRPDDSWMWVEVMGRNLMDDPVIEGVVVYARDITERKESQRTFEQYRTLVENVADPMYILDTEGIIQMVNDAFEDALGYPSEEAIGKPVGDFMPDEDVERGNELIRELLADPDRKAGSFEMVAITASGEEQLHETKLAVLTENSKFLGSVGIFRDIAERKANEALQLERDRLGRLFDYLPNPVIHADMSDAVPIIKQVNPEFESTFGYDAEEVIGRSVDEVTVPEDQMDEAEAINEQIMEEGSFQVEVKRATADGSREFVLNGVLRDPESDSPDGYAIYTDITDRKHREEELETIRERMAFALEATDSYIYEIDQDSGVETRHGAFERLYGLPSEDVSTSEEFYERAVHPDDRDDLEHLQQEVLPNRPGELLEIEYRTHPETGEDRWVKSAAYVREVDSTRLIGLTTDVTEHVERERELAKTTAKLQALVSAFPDVTVLKDLDGNELETFGRPDSPGLLHEEVSADADTRSVEDVFPPEQVGDVKQVIRQAADSGDIESFEYQLEVPAGNRWFEARVAPVGEPIDDTEVVAWVARDITDRKQRERELRQQNARLDEFASVVSHDLRNPLNLALGRLDLLVEDCENEHTEVLSRSLQRMSELVDDLLALAYEGGQAREMSDVDLAQLAEKCWLTVDSAEADLAIESDQTIRAHPSRLQQLLENLLRNAVEHGGEDVKITLEDLETGDGFAVADDGQGIPARDREAIFEFGFTSSAGGTGYGLAIVQEIVNAHGWELTVTESESGGARFEFKNVEIVV